MSDCRPENLRDIVDPYVAEALYDETIAWNIDMRGGGSVLEWPSWEELPDMAREHWMSMAVTARVASRAALESSEPADLIAVVRAGVESGTIKGEEAECLECSSEGVTSCRPFPCEHGGHTCAVCRGVGRVLVIPLSGPKPYRQIGNWTRTTNG